MKDLNTSIIKLIKKIFFNSYQTFIYNLAFLIASLSLFIYAQVSFQEKNDMKFVHNLNAGNVAIEPVNTSAINFDGLDVETAIKKDQYPIGSYNTYSFSIRFYSNQNIENEKIKEIFYNFIFENISEQIFLQEAYLNLYTESVIKDPIAIFKTKNNIITLEKNKRNILISYKIQRNFLNHIISRSFICAFILLVILRILIIDKILKFKI